MEKIAQDSAVQMFNMCAYFAPEKIPVDIFVQETKALPNKLRVDIIDNLKRNEILQDLTRYSLLQYGKDENLQSSEKRILYMHRLLQEVVQKHHAGNTEWLKYCLYAIYDCYEKE